MSLKSGFGICVQDFQGRISAGLAGFPVSCGANSGILSTLSPMFTTGKTKLLKIE